ncbi:Rhodanese-like domain-containing protein [Thalictrum thalictroides]|uniref:Rhodanese-like domain-containing protein n=1 Tax=Thalictrum thalictroides TaxID=46969 RepID=A0A7J6UWW6_THATH|nr:Rhodanese-like domain-containing protein [Thalictrum thalictroides]
MCQEKNGPKYVCELCQEHGKKFEPVPLEKSCRHQTKISVAEMSGTVELESVDSHDQSRLSPQLHWGQGTKPSRKLRILCLHGFRQNASNFKGRTASLAKKLKNIVELVFIDAPHELPFIYRPCPTKIDHDSIGFKLDSSPLPLGMCRKKFAWLVAQDYTCSSGTNWEVADEPFDPLQYQQQTDGFDVSLSYLKSVFSQMGPFDGVLGFSQGAAMAASLCGERGISNGEIDFKFAILCSGFALNLPQLEPGSVACPSLHIFGNSQGKDRQITCHASAELASSFKQSCAVIMTHESGHIIPTQPPYIDRIKAFLKQFI